jgi:serine/threonine protein kinase
MALLDHPSIIRLFEIIETRRDISLVLEHAAGGELLDLIVSKGRLTENEARVFARQVVSALDYCHGLGIVHRDLKAENFLLDEQGRIKLSGV